MRLAIPQWQDRISPVFDVASRLLLLDCAEGREVRREERTLFRTDPAGRARELAELGVDVLVCGAISASFEAGLAAAGVQVIGFVCGSVEEVLPAFLRGGLAGARFRMPGCRGRRRRLGAGSNGGRGRMGGPFSAGPGGACVCPGCGEKISHTLGRPCNQARCPKCGSAMTRE